MQRHEILNKENTDRGFSATEFGDHTIKIYFKGTHIGSFNQCATTSEIMDDFCGTYWDGLQRANMQASQVVK